MDGVNIPVVLALTLTCFFASTTSGCVQVDPMELGDAKLKARNEQIDRIKSVAHKLETVGVSKAIQGLRDEDERIRVLCARRLGVLGKRSLAETKKKIEAREALINQRKADVDTDIDTDTNAVANPPPMPPPVPDQTRPIVAELIKSLNGEGVEFKIATMKALATIGDKRALVHLVERLTNNNRHVRLEAWRAIKQFDEVGIRYVIAQLKIGTDVDARHFYDELNRRHTNQIELRSRLASLDESSVPILVENLQHPDQGIRGRIALVLGQMGPRARQAIPYLIDSCNDPYFEMRAFSARALGLIGVGSSEVMNTLEGLTHDVHQKVVADAKRSINLINRRHEKRRRAASRKSGRK